MTINRDDARMLGVLFHRREAKRAMIKLLKEKNHVNYITIGVAHTDEEYRSTPANATTFDTGVYPHLKDIVLKFYEDTVRDIELSILKLGGEL